jgi:hypothetical protein
MKMIRAYLLGTLSDEDQEQVEQRFLVDQELFEEASIVEEEIIGEYLNDTLSEKEEFVRSFLATPRRREKVRMARALEMYVSDRDQAPAETANEQGHQFWMRLFRFWMRLFRAFRRQHSQSIATREALGHRG